MLKAKDIPLAFAAIAISLLLFAIVWTAPLPQLCPKESQEGRAEYQHDAGGAGPRGQVPANTSNYECDEHAVTDWWAIRIGLATVLILAGQLVMFWGQLSTMKAGLKDAADTAKAALANAGAALSAAETARHAERAYLQMSHSGGLSTAASGHLSVPMQIKNWGKTPGSIVGRRLGARVWSKSNQLPTEPPYEELPITPVAGAFVVPTGEVYWQGLAKITPAQMDAVNKGEEFLLLFGYVDYEDKFGATYRAGYARQYVPTASGSENLAFNTTPGYNADKQMG